MKDYQSIIILISILICSGLMGGIYNYCQYQLDLDNVFSNTRVGFILISSIIGALVVPLLLSLLKSDLMIIRDQEDFIKYFVLFGICLISSIHSTDIIRSVSGQFFSQVNSLENRINKVENVETKNLEYIASIIKSNANRTQLESDDNLLNLIKRNFIAPLNFANDKIDSSSWGNEVNELLESGLIEKHNIGDFEAVMLSSH